jgi:hypothetical protein
VLSRLGKHVVSIRGMDNHERIVVQLQVDVLHDVSDGTIQIRKPVVVHISEDGNMETVVLARSLRVRRKHIPTCELVRKALYPVC